MAAPGPALPTLLVGNLSEDVTEEEVWEIFQRGAPCVAVLVDDRTVLMGGTLCAFVEYRHPKQGESTSGVLLPEPRLQQRPLSGRPGCNRQPALTLPLRGFWWCVSAAAAIHCFNGFQLRGIPLEVSMVPQQCDDGGLTPGALTISVSLPPPASLPPA
jgi:hypothetical protein